MVFGKQVRIKKEAVNKYGLVTGRIYVDGLYVNAEQVRKGMAWVYVEYAQDQSLFILEKRAKKSKCGLWSAPHAIPPWEFRDGVKSQRKTEQSNVSDKGFTCGTKKYCKQMISCEEAIFYHNKCGLTRLDGDGDGVPCEPLCSCFL